ncbi:MAG: PepSY domain-containing protein [Pyrinomonadaceae bacterium]|nr:PepSY domain-containing protein [Pyrinomonadaceae bacterium]
MRSVIYRIHTWLGILVAIPVLAWASSGLLYAWPNTIEGGSVANIEAARVVITPDDAMTRANQFAGRQLPTTALTLLMRDGKPMYQAIGGMGADSLLIDAGTGTVTKSPPPGLLTRYFRQAHFYFFAGSWQVPLLILFAALACASAVSGIYLNLKLWLEKGLKAGFTQSRKRGKDASKIWL